MDDVYTLLTRIWQYIPSAGGGGSPWSIEEKNQALDKLANLRENLEKLSDKQEAIREKERVDRLETTVLTLVQNFEISLNLIISLSSTLVEPEDLERIIEKAIKKKD